MTGLKTSSTFPARSIRNSSRSRNDMWQPAQPPNQTVARLSNAAIHCFFSRAVTMNSSLCGRVPFRPPSSLVEQRARGTGLHTFAALGAAVGLAPRQVEVGDDLRAAAAAGNVFRPRAFDVPANAHAAGAKHTAVVIHAEQRMRVVHAPFRETVFVADMVHALA